MAKSRYIKDSVRSDNWYTDISVSEKLLFVYILTNDKVGLCGVYELPMKKIQWETGIDSGTLGKAFERFETVGKVCYRNGWIMITNFLRNQSMNENMIKGARREAENIKEEVWLSFANFKGFERLSNDFKSFDILNLTLLNFTSPIGEVVKENNQQENLPPKKQQPPVEEIPLDQIIDGFYFSKKIKELVIQFVEHRREMKKEMTQRALTIFLNKIKGLDENVAEAAIERAIFNKRQDIYPDKETGYTPPKPPPMKPATREEIERRFY